MSDCKTIMERLICDFWRRLGSESIKISLDSDARTKRPYWVRQTSTINNPRLFYWLSWIMSKQILFFFTVYTLLAYCIFVVTYAEKMWCYSSEPVFDTLKNPRQNSLCCIADDWSKAGWTATFENISSFSVCINNTLNAVTLRIIAVTVLCTNHNINSS